MMVSNHFDVRWVDGYSAVSDVPSSLAAMIEKLAADLPSSGDRIELAVRDIQRPDGTLAWVGLLRFVVAVSSAPRPLGFLHAAVLPAGYCVDLEGWRRLVTRRYGAHPEDRIRTLYEELAESTKDIGRERLHALAIRPEDVHELIEPLQEETLLPGLPRAHVRPGSRPPKGYPRPPSSSGLASTPAAAPAPAPAGPKQRPSQPILPLSMQVINLPEPPPAQTEDMPAVADLANDITQPMDAPSGTAAPLSGAHPRHRLHEERGQRTWWISGAALGTLVLMLCAVGWLAHRQTVLSEERDRLARELGKRPPDWDRDRVEVDRLKGELEACTAAERRSSEQITMATQECKDSLNDARSLARVRGDRVDKLEESARVGQVELQDAKSNLMKLKSDLTAAIASKDGAERRFKEADAENKRLQGKLTEREEQLSALCKGLQSARAVGKPPKECLGIK